MTEAGKRDYYEVLGVSREADTRAIKDAFRRLAMKYHPDRNKSPDAEGRFKEIAEAYAVLSDPKKRREYDTRGFPGVADFSAEDLFGGIDFGDIFGDHDFGFDFGLGGGLFERLFRHGRSGPPPGQDIQVGLEVSLESLLREGRETVRYSRLVECDRCNGSGAEPGTSPRRCPGCDGSGRKVVRRGEQKDQGSVLFQTVTTCPECAGRGLLIDKPCRQCGGSGKLEREASLQVTIPAGAEEGMVLRIPGHGLPSPDPKGEPGDLFVQVRSRPDSRFRRRGADLWREETLAVADAVLGTRLRVPTLDGTVSVSVPAGTQPGEVLRLRGKGLPIYAGDGRGDLKILVEIRIPEHLSPQQKALYRQLRDLEQKEAGPKEDDA